jgi:hypothetical protein
MLNRYVRSMARWSSAKLGKACVETPGPGSAEVPNSRATPLCWTESSHGPESECAMNTSPGAVVEAKRSHAFWGHGGPGTVPEKLANPKSRHLNRLRGQNCRVSPIFSIPSPASSSSDLVLGPPLHGALASRLATSDPVCRNGTSGRPR